MPDPQDPATFLRSKLRWDEIRGNSHAELLDWYKRLIAFRRSSPALTDGRMDEVDVRFDEEARWIVITRGCVQVACNLASTRQSVPVTCGRQAALASDPAFELRAGEIELAPDSVVIFT